MIRHIVLFKIKEECKAEIPQLVKNFYGMKGKSKSDISILSGTSV